MAKQKSLNPRRERWGLKESVLTFIPGNATYRTMRARNARQGVLFILPLIIGFLVFILVGKKKN